MKKFYKALNKEMERVGDDKDKMVIAVSIDNSTNELIFGMSGNWEIFSIAMSEDEALNHNEDSSKENLNEIKQVILNTALNICNKDKVIRDKLINTLNNINENT